MANTKLVIYLVLAIIFLYIISLPLMFGVHVDINTDLNVGKISVAFFLIPVFRKKININRMISGNEAVPESQKTNGQSRFKKFLKDCGIKILQAICVKNVSLLCKIGTGDAAADGMAVGTLRIMFTQFCAFFGFNGDGGIIEPDYDSEIFIFDFFGIFSISFADIIFAVCSVIVERITRNGTRRRYANVAK